MKPNNNFYIQLTNEIQRKFSIIKENICRLEEDDEPDDFKLNELSLCFQMQSLENLGVKAYFQPDDIYDINTITYIVNANVGYELKTTIFHEICHFLCRKYLNIKNRTHCLEFAIVCYALQAKFDHYETRFYLRSEDIHEDRSFRFLQVNHCEFDDLINSIQFKNIRQLMNKAKAMAEYVRNRYVPLGLYDTKKHC